MQVTVQGFTKIMKRTGKDEDFNSKKITCAIAKAGKAAGEFSEDTAKMLTLKVLTLVQEMIGDRNPSVEEIQDVVEEVLIASPYKKTARAYIIYREQHSRMRDLSSQFNVSLVNQYLKKTDWKVNENSNMSYSFQGLNNYLSSEISKIYWLNEIYPEIVRNAHANGGPSYA